MLTVTEGGMGFGFLALVIAYFPVLYQSFSRREIQLTLLDAWAGSPPAAAPIEAQVEHHKTIPLSPIVGIAAVAGGIALVVAGARTRSRV